MREAFSKKTDTHTLLKKGNSNSSVFKCSPYSQHVAYHSFQSGKVIRNSSYAKLLSNTEFPKRLPEAVTIGVVDTMSQES